MSTKMRARVAASVVVLSFSGDLWAELLPFEFVITRTASGLDATVSLTAATDGTLIGNYDGTNNPTGTRTKPGLFGTFGPTENLPVAVSIGLGVGGDALSNTSGHFRLDLDTAAGTVAMSGYASDFLASGPVTLPADTTLTTESFRTRSPTSAYLGGIPITLPLGSAALSALTVEQMGDNAPGILTPAGPNHYTFTVAPVVLLSATFSLLGNEFMLPGTPLPFVLAGDIVVSGNSAALTSMQPIQLMNSATPGLMLPQTPLDLPTVLPPGDTAHLLLDLTLNEIMASADGTLTTTAVGTLVPEPGALLGLLTALGFAAHHRRRLHGK